MIKVKKYLQVVTVVLVICAVLTVFIGCSGEQATSQSVRKQQKQYNIAQPIPKFEYSLERDVAIQLYEARNEEVRTWTVWRSDLGTIEGYAETIGYPIPYDVQLTNPLKSEYHKTVIEQAEPNGLYSSKNSIATWIRAVVTVDGKRTVSPIYIESRVTCYAFPIVVDYTNNSVTPIANILPSIELESNK